MESQMKGSAAENAEGESREKGGRPGRAKGGASMKFGSGCNSTFVCQAGKWRKYDFGTWIYSNP